MTEETKQTIQQIIDEAWEKFKERRDSRFENVLIKWAFLSFLMGVYEEEMEEFLNEKGLTIIEFEHKSGKYLSEIFPEIDGYI